MSDKKKGKPVKNRVSDGHEKLHSSDGLGSSQRPEVNDYYESRPKTGSATSIRSDLSEDKSDDKSFGSAFIVARTRSERIDYYNKKAVEMKKVLPIEDMKLLKSASIGHTVSCYGHLLRGADVNCFRTNFVTPLYIAAEMGHQMLTHLLLSQPGVLVDIVGPRQWTPLYIAVDRQHLKVAAMLLRHQANVNLRDNFGRTPLHVAAQHQDLSMCILLIRGGAKLNLHDGFGDTPLHIAMVRTADPDLSRLLLKHGSLPNLRSPRGCTIISDVIMAQSVAQLDIIKMLIRHGAKVNFRDRLTGRTPLHACAMVNNLEATKFLVSIGADYAHKSNDKRTAYDLAVLVQSGKVAEYLSSFEPELDFLTEPLVVTSARRAGVFKSLYRRSIRPHVHHEPTKSRLHFRRSIHTRPSPTSAVRTRASTSVSKQRSHTLKMAPGRKSLYGRSRSRAAGLLRAGVATVTRSRSRDASTARFRARTASSTARRVTVADRARLASRK